MSYDDGYYPTPPAALEKLFDWLIDLEGVKAACNELIALRNEEGEDAEGVKYLPQKQRGLKLAGAFFDNRNSVFDPTAGEGHFFDWLIQDKNGYADHVTREMKGIPDEILSDVSKEWARSYGRRRYNFSHAFPERSEYHSETWAYACEIDMSRSRTLRDKHSGIQLLSQDFYTMTEPLSFDAIFLNPPFDQPEFVKAAFAYLKPGGVMVGFLNLQTLENPSNRRKSTVAEFIKLHGDYENLGQVFKGSERTTNVSVAGFYVVRPEQEGDDYTVDVSQFQEEDLESIFAQDVSFQVPISGNLTTTSTLKQLVAIYQAGVRKLAKVASVQAELWATIEGPISTLSGSYNDIKRFKETVGRETNFLASARLLKKACWSDFFQRMGLKEILSSQSQKRFEAFVREHETLSFSVQNMMLAFNILMESADQDFKTSVCELFNRLTRHSALNDLTEHTTFKTNLCYMVGARFIVPHMASPEWTRYRDDERLLSDLDLICKKLYDPEATETCLSEPDKRKYYENWGHTSLASVYWHCTDRDRFDEYRGKWVKTRFFAFKFFKNGNVHFWATEEGCQVIHYLNLIAAEHNGNRVPPETQQTTHYKRYQAWREATDAQDQAQASLPQLLLTPGAEN